MGIYVTPLEDSGKSKRNQKKQETKDVHKTISEIFSWECATADGWKLPLY